MELREVNNYLNHSEITMYEVFILTRRMCYPFHWGILIKKCSLEEKTFCFLLLV